MTETVFFNHRVGDGIHYVNNNFRTFPDGSFQLGDTSDGCILLNLQVLLTQNGIPETVHGLWNQVYPDDPMSWEDVAYIVTTAAAYTEAFDAKSPENVADAIDDLRKMGCPELADLVRSIFQSRGFPI